MNAKKTKVNSTLKVLLSTLMLQHNAIGLQLSCIVGLAAPD
jgi:hypothetical protein